MRIDYMNLKASIPKNEMHKAAEIMKSLADITKSLPFLIDQMTPPKKRGGVP